MNFNTKYKTYLLDPHAKRFALDEKVNLILSPSLYWVKKLSLPLKKASEAKKILPSLFEDTLPDGEYSYYVYKEGEDFFAFAYNDKEILELIEQKGLSASNIKNIYFAQSELGFIDGAKKINDTESIYNKDGIIILLPCCWIDEKGSLDLTNIEHSKHSITLTNYGHIVDLKSLYIVGAILFAFIVLLTGEYIITKQKADAIVAQKESEFTRKHLKATMFENKAILKKYTKEYTQQTKLRYAMGALLRVRDVEIKSISLKKKSLVVLFEKLPQSAKMSLQKKLKMKKLSFKFVSDTKVEIAL